MKVANDQNELRKEWEWRGQKTRGGGGGGTRHREKNKAGGEQHRRQLPRAAGVSLQPGPNAAKAAQQGHCKQVLVPAPPQGRPAPGSRLARERAAAGATAAATGNSKRTTMVQVKRTGKNRVEQLPLPPADVVGMTPPRRWAAQRAASSVLQGKTGMRRRLSPIRAGADHAVSQNPFVIGRPQAHTNLPSADHS